MKQQQRHPTRPVRRGADLLETSDPAWFPTKQGETFYQIMAWLLKPMTAAESAAFLTGVVAKAATNLEHAGYQVTPAPAPPQPARQKGTK